MNASNVRQRWTQNHEGTRVRFRPSVNLRICDVKDDAAELYRTITPKGVAVDGIAPQELSYARTDGGAIGKVAALMLAKPTIAYAVVEHLESLARRITRQQIRPLSIVLSEEMRKDSAEDIAQDDLRTEETADTLRAFIAAKMAEIAIGQEALDAAKMRLAELERGR